MYGIKAAVRRLEFAPGPKEMEVVDVEKGRLVFRPVPGKPVSLADLRRLVTKAGYEIEQSRLAVEGIRLGDDRLRVPETGQVFRLVGPEALRELGTPNPDAPVRVEGVWDVEGEEQVLRLEPSGRPKAGP